MTRHGDELDPLVLDQAGLDLRFVLAAPQRHGAGRLGGSHSFSVRVVGVAVGALSTAGRGGAQPFGATCGEASSVVDMAGYVSIGRNIGARPMDDARWAEFRRAIKDVLSAHGATFLTRDAVGIGLWRDEAGTDFEEDAEINSTPGQPRILRVPAELPV